MLQKGMEPRIFLAFTQSFQKVINDKIAIRSGAQQNRIFHIQYGILHIVMPLYKSVKDWNVVELDTIIYLMFSYQQS